MGLNIISNYAADTAHRHLQRNEALAAKTMARLSSGSRTTFASDDAASLAVGTRLRADVEAMTSATTNASHAASVLQVAEGAASVITDITVRLKSLAIQAASDQLSNTERRMIDVEYQQLLQELDRVAFSASFNGKRVLGFSGDVTHAAALRSDAEFMWSKTAGGIERVDTTKAPAGSLFSSNFDAVTNSLTLVNLTTGDSQTRTLSFNPIPRGRTEKIDFGTLGVTVDINADFAKSTRDVASNVAITKGASQLGLNAKATEVPSGLRQLTLADGDAATGDLKDYDWLDRLSLSGIRARALRDFASMPTPFQEIRLSTSFENGLSAALYDDSNGSGSADSYNVDPLNFQLGRDDLAVEGDRLPGTATQLQATTGSDFSSYTSVTLTIGSTEQTLSLSSAATSTDDFVAKFNAAVQSAGGNFDGLAAAKVADDEILVTDAKGRTLDWTGQAGAGAPTDTALTPAVAQLKQTIAGAADFAGLLSVTFTIGGTAGQTVTLSSDATDTDDFVSKFNAAVTSAGGIFAGLAAEKGGSDTEVIITDSKARSLTWSSEVGEPVGATLTSDTVDAVTTRKTLNTAIARRMETITGFSLTLAGQSFTGSLSVTSADTADTLATKLEAALQGLASAGNVDPSNLTVENREGILIVSDSAGRDMSALSLTGATTKMYTHVTVRDANGQFRSLAPLSDTEGAHKSLAAGDTVVVTVHNGLTGSDAQEYIELSFRIDNTDGLAELNLASGGDPSPVALLFLNSHKLFGSAGQELDGTNFSFQVGYSPQAQDVLAFTLPALSARGLGLTHTHTATRDAARNAIDKIDPAINRVSEIRAQIGGLQNRFEFTIQNLGTMKENTEAGRSALMDLDVASEMTRHVTQQVLVQAGVAMLAQANGFPSQLLKLFQ